MLLPKHMSLAPSWDCDHINMVDEYRAHTLHILHPQHTVYTAHTKEISLIQSRYYTFFYVYGSVHHNIFYEITNRCSYMQSILFHCWVHSTCFGCFIHPSSGVQFLTASTATGTNHSIVSATYSQCGLQAMLGVSSWDDTMVCTSGCRYS